MAEFDIQYHSHNDYQKPVKESVFEFCVLPCNDFSQILIDFSFTNSLDIAGFSYKNIFGFEVLRIRTTNAFSSFEFSLRAKVDKKSFYTDENFFMTVEEENRIISSEDFFIDNHLFLTPSHFTRLSPENIGQVARYNREAHIFTFLNELNSSIHANMEYKKNVTDVKTSADDVWRLKKGVCQDFSHLFIAIARHSGIPCRYVSGYLNQGKNFIGASVMHAWVEAFIPAIGWVGFDPTNNQLSDGNYIKVAHGIDYRDCAPIIGVLKTTGKNKTTHHVKVLEQ